MQNNESGSVVRVSVGIVASVITVISLLVGAIYFSLTTRISIVEAKYDSQGDILNKLSTNVAIICVTVNAKCQN